jgi:hypothetical protein
VRCAGKSYHTIIFKVTQSLGILIEFPKPIFSGLMDEDVIEERHWAGMPFRNSKKGEFVLGRRNGSLLSDRKGADRAFCEGFTAER